jgi:hypothetical protein
VRSRQLDTPAPHLAALKAPVHVLRVQRLQHFHELGHACCRTGRCRPGATTGEVSCVCCCCCCRRVRGTGAPATTGGAAKLLEICQHPVLLLLHTQPRGWGHHGRGQQITEQQRSAVACTLKSGVMMVTNVMQFVGTAPCGILPTHRHLNQPHHSGRVARTRQSGVSDTVLVCVPHCNQSAGALAWMMPHTDWSQHPHAHPHAYRRRQPAAVTAAKHTQQAPCHAAVAHG